MTLDFGEVTPPFSGNVVRVLNVFPLTVVDGGELPDRPISLPRHKLTGIQTIHTFDNHNQI